MITATHLPPTEKQGPRRGATWCGFEMQQLPDALLMWEQAYNELCPENVVEIGTGRGAFSLFHKAQAEQRGHRFNTFDIRRCLHHKRLGHCWHVCNVFAERDYFSRFLSGYGKTLLFCDGGNKPLEVNTFGPMLHPGDVIAAHDWGCEIRWTQITEPVKSQFSVLTGFDVWDRYTLWMRKESA